MFQKFAPLIILAMFLVATYFVVQGMENATKMAKPQHKQEVVK